MTSVLILLSGFDPGTYYIEDDGIPNNGIAQLRGPDGSIIFFNIPTEFLTVTASAGRSVIINLTESFGGADINVGSLTNPAENPDSITVANIRGAGDVVLAANGAITELGGDAAADITANTLILSAGTGVGTAGNALETQVGTLEAETNTGGINLSNAGNLIIGGLTDDVVGLDVETSGNLTLVNSGSIVLSEESPGGSESVHGGAMSGNVTLVANGASSDIVSNVDQDAIAAPGGDITLTAGRDISMGTLGLNFDNDIRARGTLTLNPGRDLNVDGFADLASDGFGAATRGNVVVNAGRDINILNSTGTDGSLGAEGSAGGDVILNTGPGGFVRLLASSTATLFSSTGDVTVNADRMVISATAGISANGGVVAVRPRTGGWAMDLGSVTDGAFALELSDAELDRIFTSSLVIGDSATGPITVSSAVSPASAPNLTLRSGTDILVQASMTVTSSLTLRAGDNVFLTPSTINVPIFTAFADQSEDDGNTGGIINVNALVASTTATLTGNAEADAVTGTSANETISGLGGNDVLVGNGGNDTLNGGTGIDSMAGGLGDDFFFVDAAGDTVLEAAAEGNDRVFAGVSYTLAAGQSVEKLSTTNNTGTGAINLTGNELGQQISGNDGANTLDGKGGVDQLVGMKGNDFFFVDSAADTVSELVGEGSDRVFASVSYTLAAGISVEKLTTDNNFGTTAINLTGNEIANDVFGNNGNNTLDGGGGADLLVGLQGDDFFFVDNAADAVSELAGEGSDRVFASVSYTLAAGQSVEKLTTTSNLGTGAINLTGNEIVNDVFGNNGNNTLDGKGGADTLTGFLGDDFFNVDNAGDVVVELAGEGNDRVFASVSYALAAGQSVEKLTTNSNTGLGSINLTGNELANQIFGNDGNNVLDGKGGADVLTGLNGVDSFAFTTALGAGNIDQVAGFVTGVDKIQLENAIFTGLAAGALPASAFVIGAAAADASDRIIYNNATGALLFDADGVGGAAAVQFATLQGAPVLAATDFIVV